MDLRIEMTMDNSIALFIYRNGKEINRQECDSAKELAVLIKERDLSTNARDDIKRIFIHRGPGGYSRLRSIHALSVAIAQATGAKIIGYKEWSCVLLGQNSADEWIVKAIYANKIN